MRVLVVGLATTGASVVSYTRAAGHDVTVLDDAPGTGEAYAARVARAESDGARVLERPDAADGCGRGPRRRSRRPQPRGAPRPPRARRRPRRRRAGAVRDRSRRRPPAGASDAPKLVAVTGTNGKTTVTTLIDAILREAGITSAAAGNIGRPLLDAAGDDVQVVVAEVSSFQLAFTTDAFAPDVAVLLNVAEDHLDWHGSADAYAQAKAELFRHQGASGLVVVNRDDPVALALAAGAPAPVVRFGTGLPAPGDYGVVGSDLVGPPGVLAAVPASGAPHDTANALAAAAAALAVGADIDSVARAIDGFGGLAHRVQLVAERGGVRWYDDSKATNPHATAGALAGFEHVVLIAGGRNKGLDLGGLPRARAATARGRRHR